MPQQKKTAPIEAADLPDISEADQEFARLVALGKCTLADAFRQTHDCASWLPNSIWCAASKLRSSAKVQQWIAAFRTAGIGGAVYTLEQHVAELQRLKDLSTASGNLGAAVQCEQTIGKAVGLHVDRIQEVPHDPVDALRQIARDQPDIAASLAQQAGIAVEDVIPSTRTLN